MYTTKLYAKNINNLTDARYFSALMFDWMSLSIPEEESPKAWLQEMLEWISGPMIALDVSSLQERDAIDDLTSFCDGFQFNEHTAAVTFLTYSFLELSLSDSIDMLHSAAQNHNAILLDATIAKNLDDKLLLQMISKAYQIQIPIWVELPFDFPHQLFLNKFVVEGLVISGSPEIQTGMQNYDHIDALLESLAE